jgi:hypothetical protein
MTAEGLYNVESMHETVLLLLETICICRNHNRLYHLFLFRNHFKCLSLLRKHQLPRVDSSQRPHPTYLTSPSLMPHTQGQAS